MAYCSHVESCKPLLQSLDVVAAVHPVVGKIGQRFQLELR